MSLLAETSASSGAAEEEMVFDMQLKRLVPASALWDREADKAADVTTRTEDRLIDLRTFMETLQEAHTITAVRERDVCAKIEKEADMLVHLIRRRQEALQARVKAVCDAQAATLQGLHDKAEAAEGALASLASAVSGETHRSVHHRLDALYRLEEALGKPVYFDAPPQVIFNVTAKTVDVDASLALSELQLPVPIPGSLAVRISRNADVACPLEPAARGPGGVAPGILHYLATAGGTRAFRNPHENGIVTVTGSFVCGGPAHVTRSCVGPGAVPTTASRSRSQRDGRIMFDFGEARRVVVTSYCLQHGHEEAHAALRSWNLAGSCDGERWVVLDRRMQDEALGTGPFNSVVFDVGTDLEAPPQFLPPSAGPTQASYRFLALEITGANGAGPGNYHIEVGHVEFYGLLRSAHP